MSIDLNRTFLEAILVADSPVATSATGTIQRQHELLAVDLRFWDFAAQLTPPDGASIFK
jgi:hypothetical protein